jgi:glycosyltransferase involved in cell wall biosynthesis
MATFNGRRYLAEQLQSIAAQTRPPDELVICDDGSTDDTPDIVSRFAESSPFPVRRPVNEIRLGPARNFARAIGLCGGDIIALADQDDRWRPEKLDRFHEAFVSDGSVGLIFSDLRMIDEKARPTGGTQWQALGFGPRPRRMLSRGKGFDLLLRYNPVSGAAMAFRASLRGAVLPIPDGWMHDEWIALIASAVSRIAAIDDTLQDYRVHRDQQVGPGVRGIRGQLAYARKHMDEAYFTRMLGRTHAARDRITSLSDQLVRPDAPDLLARRIDHYQNRVNMRRPGHFRLPMIFREWLLGRYRRFGYGWKSAAQDLLLR